MHGSPKLCEAIGHEPSRMRFAAVGLMSGMFYTNRKLKTAKRKKNPAVERRRKAIEKEMKTGTFFEQPIWSNIKVRRSIDPELLNNTALIDCTREYTYTEMFEEWDKYARVFSALNITGENHSRVAIGGAITAEPVFAFYGLNMTGAEVSMFSYPDFVPGRSWKTMIEKEKITDLLISDIMVSSELWKELQAEKDKLGLRNIILIHSKMGGPAVGPAELIFNEVNYHIFDLFNTPPQKKKVQPQGFGKMPFRMPFPFGMPSFGMNTEKNKPEIPESVKYSLMKFGNRMIGKL